MLYPKDPAISVERKGNQLLLTWKRRTSEGWLLMIMGALVTVGIGFASLAPLENGEQRSWTERFALIAFFGVFSSLPMMYAGLVTIVNRVSIHADQKWIRQSSTPLW